MRPAGAKPARRGARHARRAGIRHRRVAGRRLPSAARVMGVLALAAAASALVLALHGPWLRVTQVAHAGERYTAAGELAEVLHAYRGRPLLAVDSAELAARLRALPAVAAVRVEARLPGQLSVSVTEKAPALTWLTPEARLLVAADGAVIASLPRDAEPPADLAALPAVNDQRSASRDIGVGHRLPAVEVRTVERLLAVDPELLGSHATGFALRVDEEYGFILVSSRPAWSAAFGFYQVDPVETEPEAVARLDSQVRAVRTLFSEVEEASVSWLDARNPGKVYWAQ